MLFLEIGAALKYIVIFILDVGCGSFFNITVAGKQDWTFVREVK